MLFDLFVDCNLISGVDDREVYSVFGGRQKFLSTVADLSDSFDWFNLIGVIFTLLSTISSTMILLTGLNMESLISLKIVLN